MERSQLSRDRATKQGKEDEAAVMGYLGRSARPAGTYTTPSSSSTSSSTASSSSGSRSATNHHRSRSTSQGRRVNQHHRRGSMPTTSTEMERAAIRRSSCSTSTSAAATSNPTTVSRPTPAASNVQTSRSQPGSRTNSMSHGMKRVQSSVDSLLTRVASATRGDYQSKNVPGSNATFDDAVVLRPPPFSISTPSLNNKREDTALLEPFVYPRPSASRRNTMN